MRILIVGATGMVGRGVLRECLKASDVETVDTLGRSPTGERDTRLHELLVPDLFALPDTFWSELEEIDACFFCLGVSSAGMDEPSYTRLTYELALEIARPLSARFPAATFVYISGAGTDPESRTMWARVKGRTERALAQLPFSAVFSLRPGVILPMNGERSGVRSYRLVYRLAGPVLRLLRRVAPTQILTTEIIGRSMLALARRRSGRAILEAADIYAIAIGERDMKA